MTSLQSLWALVNQLGLEPTALLSKASENAFLHLGGKATAAAGKRAGGAAKAILSYWSKTVEASFPAYLEDRLVELGAQERPAVVEAAFAEWVASRTTESSELSRLLFRLIYLQALISHCTDLPILAENRLNLDDVWVPQSFRHASSESFRKHQGDQRIFSSLGDALSAGSTPLVLLGDSGAGKSTQLRKLVLDVSRRQLEMTDFEGLIAEPLPVYVQAKTLAGEIGDLTTTVSQAISRELDKRLPFPLPERFLDSRQPGAPSSLLLVIDGLDEIASELRDNLVSSISRHGDRLSILLGSRSPLPQQGIAHIEIQEPTSEQSDALMQKLTAELDEPRDVWTELPRNPLILTLAALLPNQAIASRATLYREFLIDRMSRNPEAIHGDLPAGLRLLEACALADTGLGANLEYLTADFLPLQLVGLARSRSAKRLLIATGAIREAGDQLAFLHESFRSFLKAEALAREHQPSPAPWGKVSPFREGWEVLGFMLEIWRRDGEEVAPALEGLLAFGEAGLRLVGQIASRDVGLPVRVIEAIAAKWMHGDDDDWSPGYMDGPVQQLGLLARHYECARAALRRIARDNWTFSHDSAYAARELARAGLREESQELLIALSRKENILWDDRVLAIDLLTEIGSTNEARICGLELASEWPVDTSDPYIAWTHLASALHKLDEKRVAARMLDKIEAEVDSQFGLEFLAGTYAELGKPRKAKAVALRAFHARDWIKSLSRGSEHDATSLANLLHQVGATREAESIRSHLDQVERTPANDLAAMARDRGKRGHRRQEASLELLKRQPKAGIAALEVLLNDPGVESYYRFSEVDRLLDSPARHMTIEALRRIAADEPWHRIDCGYALVKAGEPEEGCALLRKVAFEPGEEPDDRVRALERLAQSGRVDLAIATFRRLLHSGSLDPAHLREIEAALAYTAGWVEFLDACEDILAADDPRLRIEALAVLARASRISRGTKRALNLLGHIARNRELDPEIRARALRELENTDGDATDLAINITEDAAESMEAGLAAMEFLRRRDSFYAVDCGHDVVWDKKLSADQFIEAARRFLSMIPATTEDRDEDEDGLGYWGRGVGDAMQEKLLRIAADPHQPIERRLAAAGVIDRDRSWREKAFRPALDAICGDESLSLRERLPAIHDLLVDEPAQYTRWKDLFWSDQISRIEAAYVCLTTELDMRDVAAEFFHAALEQEDDLHLRVRIWKELVQLVEVTFAGNEAAKALRELIQTKEHRLDSQLVTDLLSLSKIGLQQGDYKNLVAEIAASERLDAYGFSAATRELIEVDLESLALDLTTRRKMALKSSVTRECIYERLAMVRAEASLGRLQEAIESLNALCVDPKLKITDRVLACRILSQLGRTGDANRHLGKLADRARSFGDRLAVANGASAQHDWALARRVLLASQDMPQSSSEQCQFASALAAAGLTGRAMTALKSVNTGTHEFLWEGGLDLLLEQNGPRRAAAICRTYLESGELDVADCIEAFGKLGDAGDKTTARQLLVRLVKGGSCLAPEQADVATALYRLGFEAEANSIFFDLAEQRNLSPNSILWIADAMLGCGLGSTAASMLASINEAMLDADERDEIGRIKEEIRLATCERKSRIN